MNRTSTSARRGRSAPLFAALTCALALPAGAQEESLSGRFVVPADSGGWQRAEHGDQRGAVFYPSWFVGFSTGVSQLQSSTAGDEGGALSLVVGNHFKPQWRWELSVGAQQFDLDDDTLDERSVLYGAVVDWLPLGPDGDGGLWLRAGVSGLSGDGAESEALGLGGDPRPLAGIGFQWRDDRWLLRLGIERHGDEQDLLAASFVGYLGGRPQPHRPAASDAVEPRPEPAPIPALETCAADNLDFELMGLRFVDDGAELDARNRRELAQIGSSVALRYYIHAALRVGAPNRALAEARVASVLAAMDPDGALRREGRLRAEAALGGPLALRLVDYRPCL